MITELLKSRREANRLKLFAAHAKERNMKQATNFDYIDAAVMEKVRPDNQPRRAEQEKAKDGSRAIIAGFPVNDPEAEKKMLDELIAKRNKSIQTFIDDRKNVTQLLKNNGIKPLAVVPTKAWAEICKRAKLVVMAPDSQGRVTVSREALALYGSVKAAEAAAKSDHAAYVRALFPQDTGLGTYARVVLPNPPEDVAAILLKAKGLKLNVAAVPEAIRFVETPTELYNSATVNPQDEWARRQGYADYKDWVKRDPIVFHDHGTASAIIAQFGDFPIEKQVVDIVMANDNLIPDEPAKATIHQSAYNDINQLYRQQMQMQAAYATAMQHDAERARYNALMFGQATTANALIGTGTIIAGNQRFFGS